MEYLKIPLEYLWICNKVTLTQVHCNVVLTKESLEWLSKLKESTESKRVRGWASGKMGAIKDFLSKKPNQQHFTTFKKKKRKIQRKGRDKPTRSDVTADFLVKYIDENIHLVSNDDSIRFLNDVASHCLDKGYTTEKQVVCVNSTIDRFK